MHRSTGVLDRVSIRAGTNTLVQNVTPSVSPLNLLRMISVAKFLQVVEYVMPAMVMAHAALLVNVIVTTDGLTQSVVNNVRYLVQM